MDTEHPIVSGYTPSDEPGRPGFMLTTLYPQSEGIEKPRVSSVWLSARDVVSMTNRMLTEASPAPGRFRMSSPWAILRDDDIVLQANNGWMEEKLSFAELTELIDRLTAIREEAIESRLLPEEITWSASGTWWHEGQVQIDQLIPEEVEEIDGALVYTGTGDWRDYVSDVLGDTEAYEAVRELVRTDDMDISDITFD